MKRFFPAMYNKPEPIQIFLLIPACVWVFILFPLFMPFIGMGLWEQWELSVWLEIGYHVANGLLVLFLIFAYLKEEIFMVTTEFRFYLKHILLTVGLIIGVEIVWTGALFLSGFDLASMLEHLPVSEMTVSHTSLFVLELQPIFGTITFSIFEPITVCGLFYCLVFAPLCNIKPWLGYLGVAVMTLIPPVIDIIWRGNAAFVLVGYLATLPVHLLACWSYQKTDNVWTPIFSLAGANLLTCGLMQIYLHFVF